MAMKQTFKVQGMHCSACEKILEMDIGALKGVSKVKANAAKGTLDVEGAGCSGADIRKAIKDAGYQA
jgi:copper chaperone CopZ